MPVEGRHNRHRFLPILLSVAAEIVARALRSITRAAQACSRRHFAMKLFFAAPLSGLPSEPIALGAHASR